jgi:NitT/TauT family transport system substrate-binding protein
MQPGATLLRLCGLATATLLGLAACTPPAPPLQVGSNHWAGYEALYYARELGLLDPSQVRLQEFSSTQEALRAFRNGALDAVAVTLDEALLLGAQEQSPRIVAVMDVSMGADVLLARPGIAALADLAGRRIGVETTTLGAYMLARILAKAGLAAGAVQVVDIPVDRHRQAYLDGEVDAVITFEPVRSQLLAAGARELFSSREIPGEIVDVLVVRGSLLGPRQQAVCHLLGGYYAALAELGKDPQRAARALAGPEGISPAELAGAWRLMELPGRKAGLALLGSESQGLGSVLAKLEGIMLDHRLLARDIDEQALLAPQSGASCPP